LFRSHIRDAAKGAALDDEERRYCESDMAAAQDE